MRRAQAARYAERLAGAPQLSPPAVPEGDEPVWHLFVVRHPRRDAMREALAAQGIETLIHYPKPVYRFPPFAQHAPAQRSRSDAICDEVLSLPIGPHLGLDQVDRVAEAVAAFCEGGAK